LQPVVETKITLHTVWHALTGQVPPLALPSLPLAQASLDSRTIRAGDLFIALRGLNTDGNLYVGQALQAGARVVICEPHARDQLAAATHIVDCSRPGQVQQAWYDEPSNQWANSTFAFVVTDSVYALQQVGGFHRLHHCHPDLRVIGVTGSVGKTSTKELIAAILQQRFQLLSNKGNLNSDQGLPLTLLELQPAHERAVLEMGMTSLREIHTLCTLARPSVGVITNVGPSHLSRLGTMERIAQAKAELVNALPAADAGGIAILNWDDEWVRAMASQTTARIFSYGLSQDADLWADEIQSSGLEGIRFRFHYKAPGQKRPDSLHVRVPLLGRHSVHTALRAASVGLVEGLSWEEIVAGMQSLPGQLRLVVVPGLNGSTVIDDTYNASPASTIAALNLLQDLEPTAGGRRVAVLGDMLELGHHTDEGHKIVGRRAAAVVDMMITVGELGKQIGMHALSVGFKADHLFMMPDADQAIQLIRQEVNANDLVLVKGSRAVGMDYIVMQITGDSTANQPAKSESKEA
jgi:UDP-N-acetylmuramoyl-tripeptide--D-alanyl-D-alanine ligase